MDTTRGKLCYGLVMVSLTAFGVLAGAGPANADPDRISRGEAEAVYQAAGTGGLAILRQASGRAVGVPANQEVAIRPYFDSGLHYCVEDWHAIMLAFIGDLPTMQAARDSFDPVVFTFHLDGILLDTERTQVKPYLYPESIDPEWEVAFAFQQGLLMAPGDLTVGSHTVTMTSVNPDNPDDNFELESQFFVDATGTGTCL
jgi:hypothetical protein